MLPHVMLTNCCERRVMATFKRGDLVTTSQPPSAANKLFRVASDGYVPNTYICEDLSAGGNAWVLYEQDLIPATSLVPGVQMSHKYKPGTTVVHKTSGQKAEIRSHAGYNHLGSPLYRIEYDNYWFGSDVAAESDLNEVLPTWSSLGKKCECGSELTYGDTGFHSHWCPKFTDNK